MTKNLKDRYQRHNKGRKRTTRPYIPFKLIFVEKLYSTRSEARIREKYWKSGVGKEKLRLLKDDNIEIEQFLNNKKE
jgi:putative endonuclease